MSSPDVLTILQEGEIVVQGQFVWGSNYTFLAQVQHTGITHQAVYKPRRGERPLWDFPAATLAHREAAAYLVSEALGWSLVPPTVYRRRGPLGPGSLQLFVEHDPEYHFFTMSQEDRQRLRPVVMFDLLANNADRKGGHVLVDTENHIWLIDHGVCFHVEDKLRTVIWDFAGEAVPEALLADIRAFRQKLDPPSEFTEALQSHLNRGEIAALATRADNLLTLERFPLPSPDRRPYPWPPL